jgi:hypothetical protein
MKNRRTACTAHDVQEFLLQCCRTPQRLCMLIYKVDFFVGMLIALCVGLCAQLMLSQCTAAVHTVLLLVGHHATHKHGVTAGMPY